MINIHFHIDGKKHESPKSWADVEFSYYLGYFDKVANKQPQQLTDFMSNHFKELNKLSESLTKEAKEAKALELFNSSWEAMPWREKIGCYHFFALDVGYWCKVDSKILLKELDKDTLTAAFWLLQVQMNPDNATVDESYTGFLLDGKEFLLPSTHMVGSTVEEFADAAQFQENLNSVLGGNWLSMLDVMSVICRPKGETYNDSEAFRNKRKKLFESLTMDHVINCAFFLHRLNETLRNNLLIYTAKEELQTRRQKLLATGTDGRQ